MTRSATKLSPSLAALGAMLALLQGTPAQAATFTKTYVSNTGNDVNDCSSVANACATFQHAHNQTSAGGEISVVNTGNYGRMAIAKSVHVTNDGAGEATILGPGTSLLLVDGKAGDIVGLRGLVIDGKAGAINGIFVARGSAVHIQNCVIRNILGINAVGILIAPSNNMQVFVSDTIVSNNGSTAATGGVFVITQEPVSANVVLDRVHLENNVIGLLVDGHLGKGDGARAIVRHSVISGNASDGIRAITASGRAPAFIVVERTSVVDNAGTGILADGPGATMLLDRNVVSRNGVGISAVDSGQLISYGNNKVNNNVGVDGVPTGSYSPI